MLIADNDKGFLKRMHIRVESSDSPAVPQVMSRTAGFCVPFATQSRTVRHQWTPDLYRHKEWATDGERRRTTAVPRETEFATTPEFAWRRIERTI